MENPESMSLEDRFKEKQKVIELETRPPETPFYIVESSWIKAWAKYIHGGLPPGKLTTSSLKTQTGQPKKGLRMGHHYRALTETQWKFLANIHGSEVPLLSPTYTLSCHRRAESGEETNRQDPTLLELPKSLCKERSCSPASTSTGISLSFAFSRPCTELPQVEGDDQDPFLEEELSCRNTDSTNPTSNGTPMETEDSTHGILKSGNLLTGKIGLENPSLYCYMNTGIQLLFSVGPLVNFLAKMPEKGFKGKSTSNLFGKLVKKACKMKSGVIKTKPIRDLVNPYFPGSKQHDTPEFLRFIINRITTELSDVIPIAHQIFDGELSSKVTCSNCLTSSTKLEPFIDLQLEMKTSLKRSFENFTSEELITPASNCENCNTAAKISKKFSISRPPLFLLVQIKRFKQVPHPHKTKSHCKFRKTLELDPYSLKKACYELVGVGVHLGEINSGHYQAFCKREKHWYKFDDEKVTKVSSKEVVNLPAYVLLYKRSS